MRAAVFKGLGQKLHLEKIADPAPGAEDIIVRVGRCGICGSDLHMTREAAFNVPVGAVLGHEFAGEVVAAGKGARSVAIGDRVGVPPMKGCGNCIACLSGEPGACRDLELIGGGYGEYVRIAERQAIRLPGSASIADGALIEPLAVALHGVRKSALKPGDNVVVLGAGPIGLATAFWARRMGARRVVITDLDRLQEERSMILGATDFVAGEEDHVLQSDRILNGKADLVFECVGVPGMIAQAVEHVRLQGEIVVQGLCTQPDEFIPFRAISKECRIQFSNFFKIPEYEAALNMLASGVVEPRTMITQTISLDELPDTFEALRHRTGQCKVQVAP